MCVCTVKALILRRICQPQCSGTKYYISSRATIHATEEFAYLGIRVFTVHVVCRMHQKCTMGRGTIARCARSVLGMVGTVVAQGPAR
jgi:hypothetical protein